MKFVDHLENIRTHFGKTETLPIFSVSLGSCLQPFKTRLRVRCFHYCHYSAKPVFNMSGNSQMIRPSRPFQTISFVATLPLPLATILELRRELRRVSNLKLIYKLTPPCKKSSWDWLFDQVWYSKDEQRSSSDSWQRLPKPYKLLKIFFSFSVNL